MQISLNNYSATELSFEELMSIDGGNAFSHFLGELVGILTVIAIVCILL